MRPDDDPANDCLTALQQFLTLVFCVGSMVSLRHKQSGHRQGLGLVPRVTYVKWDLV